MPPEKNSKWESSIPWFLTIASIATLVIIGLFLVNNVEWYKSSVFSSGIPERNTPQYRFYAYHMHLSMIKRSIGLFSGFAVMFLGTSVMFYTIKSKMSGQLTSPTISANIATASPGIIALIVGCYIIVETIKSKDEFPQYVKPELNEEIVIPPPPPLK